MFYAQPPSADIEAHPLSAKLPELFAKSQASSLAAALKSAFTDARSCPSQSPELMADVTAIAVTDRYPRNGGLPHLSPSGSSRCRAAASAISRSGGSCAAKQRFLLVSDKWAVPLAADCISPAALFTLCRCNNAAASQMPLSLH